MADFFSFLKLFVGCSTLLFLATLILLALPQSKLRAVGLELTKYALAAGLVLLIPSPVDVVPDVIPGIGWLDDIGYIVAAIAAVRSGLASERSASFTTRSNSKTCATGPGGTDHAGTRRSTGSDRQAGVVRQHPGAA